MKNFRDHINRYRYGINGIAIGFRLERNMSLHLVGAVGVILMNIVLEVTQTEWLITLMLIGMVLTAEFFNTAIERLSDRVTFKEDPLIRQVKDLASGAVLITCVLAVACASIIYLF